MKLKVWDASGLHAGRSKQNDPGLVFGRPPFSHIPAWNTVRLKTATASLITCSFPCAMSLQTSHSHDAVAVQAPLALKCNSSAIVPQSFDNLSPS